MVLNPVATYLAPLPHTFTLGLNFLNLKIGENIQAIVLLE